MKVREIQYLLLLISFFLPGLVFTTIIHAQDKDITIKVHVRGVCESKISLLPLAGPNALNPIAGSPAVTSGETVTVNVPKNLLPGEFVLRFDYKDTKTSTPSAAEKHIFACTQDLELFINPSFCSNSDSAWFQKGESENTVFARFSKENGTQKEKLVSLQNFLMSYDDNHSAFYKAGIDEYEKRRTHYNEWLATQTQEHKTAFVSNTFQFQYVPQTEWKDGIADRRQSMITHYFDGINFKYRLLLMTTGITECMNKYVNIYGALSTTKELRDSLFSVAATRAIDKARAGGNPYVYGWMVDYFYNGFETNGIPAGIKALQPYLDDPNCYTSKKQQIEKRPTGMKWLQKGSVATDFTIANDAGKETKLVLVK